MVLNHLLVWSKNFLFQDNFRNDIASKDEKLPRKIKFYFNHRKTYLIDQKTFSILTVQYLIFFYIFSAFYIHFNTEASEKLHVVVLVSTINWQSTLPRHYAAVQTIETAIRIHNETQNGLPLNQQALWSLNILAQDTNGRTWEINQQERRVIHHDGPEKLSFSSLKNLESLLKKLKRQMRSKNQNAPFLIIIVGHGTTSLINPTRAQDHQDTSFFTWGEHAQPIPFSALQNTLKDFSSPTTPIRIVCLTCFGGGVHSLARNLDHICTTANSPFCMPAKSNEPQSDFHRSFWEQHPAFFQNESRFRSFAEVVIEAAYQDPLNLNVGSLSSSSYIDSIFQRGPYLGTFDSLLCNGKIRSLYLVRDPFHSDTIPDRQFFIDASYIFFQASYAHLVEGNQGHPLMTLKQGQSHMRTLGPTRVKCVSSLISPSDTLETLLSDYGKFRRTLDGHQRNPTATLTEKIEDLRNFQLSPLTQEGGDENAHLRIPKVF